MVANNVSDRRRQTLKFSAVFAVLLGGIFLAGSVSLISAQQGVTLLEAKKSSYDRLFQKQAEFNFAIEEIFRDLHNLRSKKRTTSEYKYMQKIITQKRMLMEEELLSLEESHQEHYTIYIETQAVFDAYDSQSRKREYNMDQLEKCRQKYQEISKRENGTSK